MAQRKFTNGEGGDSVRSKIDNNFAELYPKRINITDQGTPIVFSTPIPIDTEFEVIPIACQYIGQNVGVVLSDVTRLGMTATSAEPNATLFYQILTY